MSRRVPSKPWLYLGCVGMERAPRSARRGLLGRKVAPRTPDEVEADVVEAATAYRSGCLGAVAGLGLAVPLAYGSDALGRWMEVALVGRLGEVATIASILLVGAAGSLAWLAVYLWLAWRPTSRGLVSYGRVAGAIAALEDMPQADRASWVADYRSSPRPAGAVLERSSSSFSMLTRDESVRADT